MTSETITYNNKKVIKKTNSNGEVSYILRGLYLGIDEKTGKQVTTSITAKTLRQLDRKILTARVNFEKAGGTRKEDKRLSTFSELAEEWFNNYQVWVTSHNTFNRVTGYVYNYIIPAFGDYIPEKITSADIQRWVNNLAQKARTSIESGKKRAEKGSAKDFGAVTHKLSDIFDFGITHFGLTKNPVKTIKIPPKPKLASRRTMVLHDEELKTWLAFLKTLPNNRANRRFITICNSLLASALRINELLALEINDLDFTNNEIIVNKTLMWKSANKKLGTKGCMICKPTANTDSGNRQVPVPNSTLTDLRDFYTEMNNYFKKQGLPQSKLIFPTIYGNYMCDRNERATLKKRLTSLGLPDYGFHIFRHTHASMMLNAGANWKELQVRMGHKSINTTMDTYAELAPKKKLEAVDIYLDKIAELST